MLDRFLILLQYGQDLGAVSIYNPLQPICAVTHNQAVHHRTKVRPVPAQRAGNIIKIDHTMQSSDVINILIYWLHPQPCKFDSCSQL